MIVVTPKMTTATHTATVARFQREVVLGVLVFAALLSRASFFDWLKVGSEP